MTFDGAPTGDKEVSTTGAAPLPLQLSALPRIPYRGIEPFRYIDQRIFFAREEETSRLVRYVTMYRGVLFYGDSGSGKSSVINAGFIPAVLREGFAPEKLRVQPRAGEEIRIERISTSDDGKAPFLPTVFADQADATERVFLSVGAFKQVILELPAGVRPVLIFDQFEELFTLFEVAPQKGELEEARAAQSAIVSLLVELLRDHTLPIKLLFVFREDYLAKLNKLLVLCPDLRDQFLRLTSPRTDALPRIIRGPFDEFPGNFESELAPDVAVKLDAAIRQRSDSATINLSEAQIVCLALWQSADPATLLQHKGVQGILEEYLSQALTRFPEELRDPVVALLSRMVTDSGTRNIVSEGDLVRDLSREEGIAPEISRKALEILEITAKLVRREPRHDVYFYEIVSEFLVPWIVAQKNERLAQIERRKGQQAEELLAREQQKARALRRRLSFARSMLAVAVVAAITAALMTIVANRMWAEATRQEQIVHSHQLAAQAVKYAEDRVDLALLLAREAGRKGDFSTGRDSLIAGLAASPSIVSFLHAHTGHIMSLAVSPDRRVLASAGEDQTINLWSLRSTQLIAPLLRGHEDVIYDLSFSPDGTMLASASADRTIRLWDLTTGEQVGAPLIGHTDVVHGVEFSPDGKFVASSSGDATILLWDVRTRQPVRPPLNGHNGPVYTLAFSPDGKRLASGGADKRVVIWDVASGQVRARLNGQDSSIFKIAFQPGAGNLLASGGSDGSLLLWNVTARTPTPKRLGSHLNAVYDLDFSADGQQLVSASTDKSIMLWDVKAQERLEYSSGIRFSFYSVAFADRGVVAAGGDGTILLLNVSDASTKETRALAARDRQALRPGWLGRFLAFDQTAHSIAFSPDAKTVVAGTNDGLMMWDVEANESRIIGDQSPDVGSIAFSPDGRVLAAAGCTKWLVEPRRCGAGEVQFWDVGRRKRIGGPLTAHRDWISSVAFSPDGKTLATGSYDDDIRLWDVDTRQARGAPLASGRGDVNAIAFSVDGQMLASGTDKGVVLWDIQQRESEAWGNEDLVWSVAFSPDGKTLASGSRHNGDVTLWDLSSGQTRSLSRHRASVLSLAFSPDSTSLATGSRDNTIILWDVRTGQARGLPLAGSNNAAVLSIAFSPDGNKLASGTGAGPVILWDVGLESMRALACVIAGRNLTKDEWERHFAQEPYQITCSNVLVNEANTQAIRGDTEEARSTFQRAVELALKEKSSVFHNSLCWYGALNGFADIVWPSCEQAVELAPASQRGNSRDTRGLARALRGDLRGAAEDFAAFVSSSGDNSEFKDLVSTRQAWIVALGQGRNPFDAATLKALRME